MAKSRQCGRCGEFNSSTAKECKDCGVPFGEIRESRRQMPTTCGFVAEGMKCGHIGILSEGTTGEGSWYCREHWDVVHGVPTTVRGNALPARTIRAGQPTWEYSGWDMRTHQSVFATAKRVLQAIKP